MDANAASNGIRFHAGVCRGFVAFSGVVGWVGLAVGLCMLATWILDAGPLRVLMQAQVGMHAASALGCLAVSAALLLKQRPAAAGVFSAVALGLGGMDLWSNLSMSHAAQTHWLDLAFPGLPGRPSARMSGMAAVAYVFLGMVGMLVASKRMLWLREACALGVIAIALASVASFGQVLAENSFDLLHKLPGMTAAVQLLLVLGWMSSVPTTGLTQVAVTDSLGGAFARRLILPSLLLPALLTFALRIGREWLGMTESTALALASVAAGGAVATMVVWVAFLLDRVERQRRMERDLRADANTDGLTGLANRRAFDVALLQSDRRSGEFAVLILDLDRFKNYNDEFGHLAGDDVLRETGRLLRTAVREQDLVARYGGEEFVVLLLQGGAEQAQRVGQRILEAFRAHVWPHRALTVSIGAAVALPDESAQALLRRADAALYRSKEAGRDCLSLAAESGQTPAL